MKVAIIHQAVPDDALPDERDVLDEAAAVGAALSSRGHLVEVWPCTLDLSAIEGRLAKVDAVFNLVETLGGSGRMGHLLPALVEARGVPCTGNTGLALAITAHKPLTKRLLSSVGVPVPASHREATGRCIVKPMWEDASLGIDDSSVVESAAAAEARLEARGPDWFAEAYVTGRELNVALIGGADPQVLPVAEIVFDGDWGGKPRIVGYDAKWTPGSFEYENMRRVFPRFAADAALWRRVEEIARLCWRTLDLWGYARVDMRVSEAGEPFVLEVNANPCLSRDAGFAASLEAAGIDYAEAVARIVALARPRPRSAE
jgi:D-alanine-D-alanine ligase